MAQNNDKNHDFKKDDTVITDSPPTDPDHSTAPNSEKNQSEMQDQESSHSEDIPSEEPQPWVDYIPLKLPPRPKNQGEHLSAGFQNLRQQLQTAELFKLAVLDQKLHNAYYRNWVQEANNIFRLQVRLQHRLQAIGKQEQEQSNEASADQPKENAMDSKKPDSNNNKNPVKTDSKED